MTRPVALLLATALFIALAWGVLSVFNVRFEAGGIYPAFSSLRKDMDGASVFYESVRRLMPGIERSYAPLESAQWSERTVLLLGAPPEQLLQGGALDYRLVESLARRGNRVVVAFIPAHWAPAEAIERIEKAWGVTIQNAGTKEAPEIHFSAKRNWTVLQGAGESPDVVERPLGKGSLVLVASSAVFANATLAASPDAALLASIVGATNGMVFDEAHLGIVESGSVMGLLRAFRLQGVLFGLLLPIALFVWKHSTSFPPAPRSRTQQRIEGRRSFSGLVALLRRNLSVKDLAAACWEEWLKGAPRALAPQRRSRVEQELAGAGSQPLLALGNIYEILNRKRTD
jgi:hypothetical protein